MPVRSKWQSLPTEQINPATLAIDKLSPADIVEGMLNEDRKMLAAVQREKDRIAVGVEIITQALRKNGRIIFVGAGTSGRLGVLESAEMPPTFGTSPELVQAIMAGGKGAILRAREGVEDNYEEGARSVNRLRPTKKDVVIGVSASGMTQFVRGALTRARKAGSKIIFVTCDPRSELQTFVDLTIAPAVGPGGDCRIDAAQGRHRDQDGPQHADHRVDDPDRQDLRQPDGRRADGIGEAARSRPPHHHHRHRPRLRRRRQAAAQARTGTSRRRSSCRRASSPTRSRCRACAAPTTSSATRSARTSKRG